MSARFCRAGGDRAIVPSLITGYNGGRMPLSAMTHTLLLDSGLGLAQDARRANLSPG